MPILKEDLCWPIIQYVGNSDRLSQFEVVLESVKQAKPKIFQMSFAFPGMDTVIVCTSSDAVYCLLLEIKLTAADTPTSLTHQIKVKLGTQMKKHFSSQLRQANIKCSVISVFVMWYPIPPNILDYNIWEEALDNAKKRDDSVSKDDFSDAILILGREQLTIFYSSLSPFADIAFSGLNAMQSSECRLLLRITKLNVHYVLYFQLNLLNFLFMRSAARHLPSSKTQGPQRTARDDLNQHTYMGKFKVCNKFTVV